MKNSLNLIVFCLLLLNIRVLFGQFSLDAQIRPRTEYREGYQKLINKSDVGAVFISQRTRLTLNYKTDNLKIKITPQDVRVWGDEKYATFGGVFGDDATFDMFEGYAEIKLKNDNWLSFGRQQLVYDNEWLLGARNWNQNGISADALLLKLKPKKADLHIGLSWNTHNTPSANNYYLDDRYKSVNFIWLKNQVNKNLSFSLIYLNTGTAKAKESNTFYFRHTNGTYVNYENDFLFLRANAYVQTGKNKSGNSVEAYLLALENGYTIDKTTSLGAGGTYTSGNKKVINYHTDHCFDGVYTARHRFYGYMDYFSDYKLHTSQAGVTDYYFFFAQNINKKTNLKLMSHYFLLSNVNENTPDSKELGFENDLILKYKINDWGELELGYCFLIPSETLKVLHKSDSNFAQFAYVMLTIKSTIFKNS